MALTFGTAGMRLCPVCRLRFVPRTAHQTACTARCWIAAWSKRVKGGKACA